MSNNLASDHDEIEEMILDDGYIDNNQLWRKWIMIQILHAYHQNNNPDFYTKFINDKPYMYTWETAQNEIYALSQISPNELQTRSKFFNHDVIIDMIDKYTKDVIRKVSSQVAMYKSFRLTDFNIMVQSDNNERTARTIPLSDFIQKIRQHDTAIKNCCNAISVKKKSYAHLYKLLSKFMNECPTTIDLDKPISWVNAFTGSGAYYTMDNLIKFHKCNICVNGRTLTTSESLTHLNECTEKFKDDYAQLFDMMMSFLINNQSKIKDILPHNL